MQMRQKAMEAPLPPALHLREQLKQVPFDQDVLPPAMSWLSRLCRAMDHLPGCVPRFSSSAGEVYGLFLFGLQQPQTCCLLRLERQDVCLEQPRGLGMSSMTAALASAPAEHFSGHWGALIFDQDIPWAEGGSIEVLPDSYFVEGCEVMSMTSWVSFEDFFDELNLPKRSEKARNQKGQREEGRRAPQQGFGGALPLDQAAPPLQRGSADLSSFQLKCGARDSLGTVGGR